MSVVQLTQEELTPAAPCYGDISFTSVWNVTKNGTFSERMQNLKGNLENWYTLSLAAKNKIIDAGKVPTLNHEDRGVLMVMYNIVGDAVRESWEIRRLLNALHLTCMSEGGPDLI